MYMVGSAGIEPGYLPPIEQDPFTTNSKFAMMAVVVQVRIELTLSGPFDHRTLFDSGHSAPCGGFTRSLHRLSVSGRQLNVVCQHLTWFPVIPERNPKGFCPWGGFEPPISTSLSRTSNSQRAFPSHKPYTGGGHQTEPPFNLTWKRLR